MCLNVSITIFKPWLVIPVLTPCLADVNTDVENTQVSNYLANVLDDISQGFNNMNVMMHLDTCGAQAAIWFELLSAQWCPHYLTRSKNNAFERHHSHHHSHHPNHHHSHHDHWEGSWWRVTCVISRWIVNDCCWLILTTRPYFHGHSVFVYLYLYLYLSIFSWASLSS